MATVKKIEGFEVDGKTYSSFEEATIEGTKADLRKFASNEGCYDYSEYASDFIIENKEKIYDYLKVIIEMERELINK